MILGAASTVFLCLFVALAAVNCSPAKRLANGRVELATKPFILPSLLGFYLFALKANVPAPQPQWAVAAAMMLYALGDLCMIFSGRPRLFVAGILCFLVGHVVLGLFFLALRLPGRSIWAALATVAASVVPILLLRRKLLRTDHPLIEKLMVYIPFMLFLIAAMASTAGGGSPLGTTLAFLGGVLFAISDSMVAIRATGQKIPPGEPVMATYTSAVLLIALGLLLLQM